MKAKSTKRSRQAQRSQALNVLQQAQRLPQFKQPENPSLEKVKARLREFLTSRHNEVELKPVQPRPDFWWVELYDIHPGMTKDDIRDYMRWLREEGRLDEIDTPYQLRMAKERKEREAKQKKPWNEPPYPVNTIPYEETEYVERDEAWRRILSDPDYNTYLQRCFFDEKHHRFPRITIPAECLRRYQSWYPFSEDELSYKWDYQTEEEWREAQRQEEEADKAEQERLRQMLLKEKRWHMHHNPAIPYELSDEELASYDDSWNLPDSVENDPDWEGHVDAFLSSIPLPEGYVPPWRR